MEILNEKLTHYLHEGQGYDALNETATPMWMTYMDAFTKFVEQSGKRTERYDTYEEMDRYPEIHLALDIISTEIFVFDPITNSPFIFNTNGKVPEASLAKIIKQFTNKLKLKETLPFAVRQSLKFGDSFYFIVKTKDNMIAGLRRIDNKDIDFIEYDEIGIEPLNYYIAKKKIDEAQMGSYLQFLKYQNLELASKQATSSVASKDGDEYYIIPRNLMVRFMNKGENSKFFPFGESYLESIFPYWKKVSLLEDSLIIYRIVRAPERRVFYIDVGKAPAKIAEKVVSQTKDEIKRRRTAASQENQELGIASSFNPLSMQEDYFFAQRADGRGSRVETLPGACLALDTKIPLLDGREIMLSEIIDEWNNDKEKVNWVYSCNPLTGELAPGKITWAGVTRKNTKVLRITLDNGETVTCTPDHKFPIRDIGFVEAKDLIVGQSLIPFRKRFEPVIKGKTKEYEQVFDVSKNEWVFTHRLVSDYVRNEYTYSIESENKKTVHHRDFNRFNNSPENLVKMNNKDHRILHQDLTGFSKEFWSEMTLEEYDTIRLKMSDGIAEKRKNPEFEMNYIKTQTTHAYLGSSARLEKQNSDPEFKKEVYSRSGSSLAKRIQTDKIYQSKLFQHLKDIHEPWKNKETIYDRELLELVISIINDNEITHKKTILKLLSENDEFMTHFQEINAPDGYGVDKRKLDSFGNQHMDKLLEQFNYSGWKDFVSKVPVYNHKIVMIEVLDYGIDVGTITVDGNEEIHNYHTFALSGGIFTKNSNLGEIADVNYFYKKLIAGMRIPGSYFNTESPPTWNDGKVGSALAEEARFGKWLTEIRSQFLWDFKILFLDFLKERGINLKDEDFDMQWKESINVAENQELEKMVQRQSVFTGFPMEQFSPQFLQRKVLGWSDEEIQENMTSLIKWQKFKDNNNLA
jgi:hypothetical protein